MFQVCSPSCGWCSGGNLPFSAVDLLIEAGDCCGFAVRSLVPHNHVTTNVRKWHSVPLWQSCLQFVLLSRVGMKSNTLTLKAKERSTAHYLFWSTVQKSSWLLSIAFKGCSPVALPQVEICWQCNGGDSISLDQSWESAHSLKGHPVTYRMVVIGPRSLFHPQIRIFNSPLSRYLVKLRKTTFFNYPKFLWSLLQVSTYPPTSGSDPSSLLHLIVK